MVPNQLALFYHIFCSSSYVFVLNAAATQGGGRGLELSVLVVCWLCVITKEADLLVIY